MCLTLQADEVVEKIVASLMLGIGIRLSRGVALAIVSSNGDWGVEIGRAHV